MLRVIIALLVLLLAPSDRTEQAHCLVVKAHALASERKQGGNEAYAFKMLGGSVAQGKFTWLGGTSKFKISRGRRPTHASSRLKAGSAIERVSQKCDDRVLISCRNKAVVLGTGSRASVDEAKEEPLHLPTAEIFGSAAVPSAM